MKELILVTGGARSGKSSFALSLAEQTGKNRLFVATCPNLDEEMNQRVARHKLERQGRGWDTQEVEVKLESIFAEHSEHHDVILIDCITLWVNNVLFTSQQAGEEITDAIIKQKCEKWVSQIERFNGTVICVTNEVGLGIVPDNKTARLYRDLVGTCNQYIGGVADKVVLVSCGIPLYLKK